MAACSSQGPKSWAQGLAAEPAPLSALPCRESPHSPTSVSQRRSEEEGAGGSGPCPRALEKAQQLGGFRTRQLAGVPPTPTSWHQGPVVLSSPGDRGETGGRGEKGDRGEKGEPLPVPWQALCWGGLHRSLSEAQQGPLAEGLMSLPLQAAGGGPGASVPGGVFAVGEALSPTRTHVRGRLPCCVNVDNGLFVF